MQLFANNAVSSTTTTVAVGDTELLLADASRFPTPIAPDFFLVSLDDGTSLEICQCTARVGNTLTVVRAQESTEATAFPIDTVVDLRLTAATMDSFLTDAPSDDKYYGRRNAVWEEVPTGGGGALGRLTQNLGTGGFELVIEDGSNNRLGAVRNVSNVVQLLGEANGLLLSGDTLQALAADGTALPTPTDPAALVTLGHYNALVPESIQLTSNSVDLLALGYVTGVFTQKGFRAASGSGLAVTDVGDSLEFSAGGLLDKATYNPDLASNTIHDRLATTDATGVTHVGGTVSFHPVDGQSVTASLSTSADNTINVQNLIVEGIATWQNATIPSDIRLKSLIAPFCTDAFSHEALFEAVGAKRFQYKNTPGHWTAGLIAQDLKPHLPEAVYTDADGNYHIKHDYLIAILWSALDKVSRRLHELGKPI